MNKFINTMNNLTYTENGAVTFKSTESAIADFFFHGAALRKRLLEAVNLFQKAYEENPTQALRILFYIRDVRGGQGEKDIFRIILHYFAHKEETQEWLKNNLSLIPEYGRWDDLFILFDTPLEDVMVSFVKIQLERDSIRAFFNDNISLLAKWMPSENASNQRTKKLAKRFIEKFKESPRDYRILLSKLRKHLDIVERKLSSKQVNLINYSKVPSKANLIYRKTFLKHDKERYEDFIESVKKGNAKINATTLYPYDLVHTLWSNTNEDDTVETLWKNLPDYVDDLQGIVVADTSGSMLGRPMEACVSLALYIAERNKNKAWKNHFISFSRDPVFHKITGNTLRQKLDSIKLGEVSDTNIEGVFELILARANKHMVPQKDMPKIILIISDMEFNSCACGNNGSYFTNFEKIKKDYEYYEYKMPTIVFWNVNSRNTQSPVTINENGVVLVSGCSPVALKYAFKYTCTSTLDMIYNVTNSERYNKINF